MEQGPWWGIPLVAGAFAVGGVLLTQLITVILHRRRRGEEDHRRWHMERRQVYVAFLTSVVDCLERLDVKRSGEDEGEHGDTYPAVMRGPRAALQEVNLIASPPVREAGAKIINALTFAFLLRWSHGTPIRSTPIPYDDPQDALAWAVRTKISAFEAVARAELGVIE